MTVNDKWQALIAAKQQAGAALAAKKGSVIRLADENIDGLKSLKPDIGFFPWMPKMNQLVGGILGMLLVVSVVLFALAAVGWVGSKIFKSDMGQHYTVLTMGGCLVAAALIASAGALVWWFAGINLISA